MDYFQNQWNHFVVKCVKLYITFIKKFQILKFQIRKSWNRKPVKFDCLKIMQQKPLLNLVLVYMCTAVNTHAV